jgi:hypothetical protein
MRFLNNTSILCLERREFVPEFALENTFYSLRRRDSIKVHGTGSNALIEFESLPPAYKNAVIARYGDVYLFPAVSSLTKLLKSDHAARDAYGRFELPDRRKLTPEHQAKYTRQAEWLNLINLCLSDKQVLKEQFNINMEQFWRVIIQLYKKDKINHELPTSKRRLLDRLAAYNQYGYNGLVDIGRFMQQNARKVDGDIERLLLSLYCRPHKPFISEVCSDYAAFLRGELTVVDLETAEPLDPQAFQAKSQDVCIKYATVQYYINKPVNRATVDKFRLSNLEYNNVHRPYMHRTAPVYALSKITMDDTSSPFKMHNGVRPACYKVFDVASGALIAIVAHRKARPDVSLIRRLLADMMGVIVKNDWALPFEVEVERALMTGLQGGEDSTGNFVNDVLTAGAVFPFIRFCAPRNPQEKRAEGFINRLKYDFQKHREGFQARPFARREAYRKNEDWKEITFSFDEILQFELEDAAKWNNSPHPDQDKYPGKTRWQVLAECQNPNLNKPDLPSIIPFIGKKSAISVRRAEMEVYGEFYRLPDMDLINRLQVKKVTAFWLPSSENSMPPSVFVFQNGVFICEAPQVSAFQEARAEQTEEDRKIMGKQKGYLNAFDHIIKERLNNLQQVATTPAYNDFIPSTLTVPDTLQKAITEAEGYNVAESSQAGVVSTGYLPNEYESGSGYMQPDGPQSAGYVQESAAKPMGYVQETDDWGAPALDVEALKRRARAEL